MNNILVCVEARGNVLQSISLELLTAARQLASETGGQVEALVMGANPRSVLALLGAADRILLVAHPNLEPYVPEAHLVVLEDVVRQRNYAVVLFAYNTVGLDLAPALALRTDRPLVAYCTKLSVKGETLEAESHIYGGKMRATSTAKLPAVIAVMPGVFAESDVKDASSAELIDIAAPAKLGQLRTTFVSEAGPAEGAVDITLAERIVCVGRGIKDKEGVETALQLATALGAEIAGSRPVIDSGWLSKERQVGKSGRKVKPKLYLALGISGAPEHLEGMSGADLIIAINTDAKAPIFGTAHYGATCDLFDLLPALAEQLK